jgi:glutamate racemase
VRAALPHEDVVYLADQAHVPYGDRAEHELRRLLASNVATLEAEGADAIVMGCNTSCAIASKYGWPAAGIPIFDLIDAAAQAVAAAGAQRVGVLATTATARSGAYGRAIVAVAPAVGVQEVAAPKLVPLVEGGCTSGPRARAAVAESLAPFRTPLDALVLACTHYPFLDDVFAELLGPAVLRVDPAVAQAARTIEWARHRQLLRPERGRTRYLTTGPLEPFRAALPGLVGPLGASDAVSTLFPVPRAGSG